jgi:hypothetical protein
MLQQKDDVVAALVAALRLFADLDTATPSSLWAINPAYCAAARAALRSFESRARA